MTAREHVPVLLTNGLRLDERWGAFLREAGFLIGVFDEWLRHDLGRVSVQIFAAALAAWVGVPPPLCIVAPRCGQAPAGQSARHSAAAPVRSGSPATGNARKTALCPHLTAMLSAGGYLRY